MWKTIYWRIKREVNIERTENRSSRIAYSQSVMMINVIRVDWRVACAIYMWDFTAEQSSSLTRIFAMCRNMISLHTACQPGAPLRAANILFIFFIWSFAAAFCMRCAILTFSYFYRTFAAESRYILEGEHICRSAVAWRVRRLSFSYSHRTRGSLSAQRLALWIFINFYFESHLIGIVYGVNSRLVALCQLSLFTLLLWSFYLFYLWHVR